jgi:hypothetical protein
VVTWVAVESSMILCLLEADFDITILTDDFV